MNEKSTPGNGSDTPDLLESAAVRVPCAACGQHYEISLRKVLLSQAMMHDGCPVHTETECSPIFNASLADGDAVRDLERNWARLSALLRARGLELTLR
jgi:hypothetical protein